MIADGAHLVNLILDSVSRTQELANAIQFLLNLCRVMGAVSVGCSCPDSQDERRAAILRNSIRCCQDRRRQNGTRGCGADAASDTAQKLLLPLLFRTRLVSKARVGISNGEKHPQE